MDAAPRRRWLPAVLLLAVLYLVVGIAFGDLANRAGPGEERTVWRLLAWVVSAVAFTAHIAHERLQRGHSSHATAAHASLAAALGAFLLAAAANVHALRAASPPRHLLLIALVAWPVLTAIPAFVVALGVAALLRRRQRAADASGTSRHAQ